MAYYETVFIARQDLSEKQNEALAKDMTEIVKKNGGEVKNTEYWGLRSLAYQINNNKKGHYTLFHIDGEAKASHELERQLRQHEDVLRYMTIRLDELPQEESVILRKGEAA